MRPPPPLRNIERRRSETWAARRARRPKHGAITCSYDNQDDLKQLYGHVAVRRGVLPRCFCMRSERDLTRPERSPGWLRGRAHGLGVEKKFERSRPKASRAARVLPLLVARVAPGVREGCCGRLASSSPSEQHRRLLGASTAVAKQYRTQSLVETSSQLPIATPWLEKLHAGGRTATKTRQQPAYEQAVPRRPRAHSSLRANGASPAARAPHTHKGSRAARNASSSPFATVGTA